jgi:hypothetical protein
MKKVKITVFGKNGKTLTKMLPKVPNVIDIFFDKYVGVRLPYEVEDVGEL